MNIFEQYGIKEVADVCLYSIELDENDDEIYIPVLYMDTLKVSTVEESTQQTSAQGGIGNPKLITWDYGKDITVTLEDALFTPASASMNWGGKLGAKGLKLHLCHFFDRNTDNNTPDTCLRTATLNVDEFSDFFIIPDRWPIEENECSEQMIPVYVGGTSIYCWLVNGYIVSDDDRKRVWFEKLILFYREQTQKWYFFNGRGVSQDLHEWYLWQSEKLFPIQYQYGQEAFDWIKANIGNDNKELEKVARVTWDKTITDINEVPEYVNFLTQNLYIDGYRAGCARDKKYSDITRQEEEEYNDHRYLPYRYFANVGVEYNTNIVPPQDVIHSIDTAYENVQLIERIEKMRAKSLFCIDTDRNMQHSQYRQLTKYSQTPLTVYINPKTMQPYQPNSFEFITKTGSRVTGNLKIFQPGETYYRFIREFAKEHKSLGRQIIIDPHNFPGTYRLVGETTKRDRYGNDHYYQFEIPLCKLHADNKLTLQADGEPTVFNMKLTALRRFDGVMMKLTEYDLIDKCPCDCSDTKKVVDFVDPNPQLVPTPYEGDIDPHIELEVETASPRNFMDYAVKENIGFQKSADVNNENRVSAKIKGTADMYSIDGTIREVQDIPEKYLNPDEYTATITGSDK